MSASSPPRHLLTPVTAGNFPVILRVVFETCWWVKTPSLASLCYDGCSDYRGGDMVSPVLRKWSMVVMRFAASCFVETQLGWVMVFDQILCRIWYSIVSFTMTSDVCWSVLVFVTHTHLHPTPMLMCGKQIWISCSTQKGCGRDFKGYPFHSRYVNLFKNGIIWGRYFWNLNLVIKLNVSARTCKYTFWDKSNILQLHQPPDKMKEVYLVILLVWCGSQRWVSLFWTGWFNRDLDFDWIARNGFLNFLYFVTVSSWFRGFIIVLTVVLTTILKGSILSDSSLVHVGACSCLPRLCLYDRLLWARNC